MNESEFIGANLRRLRTDRGISLAGVAGQAGISVPTLSRIETNKQSMEVGLLMKLAAILHVSAAEILAGGAEKEDVESLSRRVAALPAADRARIFLQSAPRGRARDLQPALDHLVSTVDMLREELVTVQHAIHHRRRKR
jgi:transcriptional regulator with XRE-family HTH domain